MKMMNNTKMGAFTYNDETNNFNFRTDLSTSDKAVFVRTVVDTIVDDTGYDSVLRDVIFDYVTISMFTDIDTSFLKVVNDKGDVVTDIDMLEDFLLSTNIIEIVKVNAFPTLFNELEKAVDLNIEYRTDIHHSPLNDAIASLLSTLEKKINEIDLNSAMSMAQNLVGMTGELTPDSIMNAYMNSDIYKKNVIEIEEAKNDRAEIAKNLDKAIKEVNSEVKAETKVKVNKKK